MISFCANERCPFHEIKGDWHDNSIAQRAIFPEIPLVCKNKSINDNEIPTCMDANTETRKHFRYRVPDTQKEFYFCEVCHAAAQAVIVDRVGLEGGG